MQMVCLGHCQGHDNAVSGGKKTPFSLLEVKANRARRREDGYHPNIFPEFEEMVPRGGKFAIAPSFPAAGQFQQRLAPPHLSRCGGNGAGWWEIVTAPIFPEVGALERGGSSLASHSGPVYLVRKRGRMKVGRQVVFFENATLAKRLSRRLLTYIGILGKAYR